MWSKRMRFLVLVCVWAAALSDTQADLELVSFGTFRWNRTVSPLESPVATIGVSSNSGMNSPNALNAFNVGLRIVPAAGAIGSVQVHSVMAPDANSVFTAFIPPPFITHPTANVPTVNGNNQGLTNVTITAPRNLFDMRFHSPSDDALGIFHIYAVPEFTNYFLSSDCFDGCKFANVPDGSDVLLGSLRVVPGRLGNVEIGSAALVTAPPQFIPEPCFSVSLALVIAVGMLRMRRSPDARNILSRSASR